MRPGKLASEIRSPTWSARATLRIGVQSPLVVGWCSRLILVMHDCGRILSSAIAMMDALEAAVRAMAGSPLFHNPSFCESAG
jgi:hypothetical protein